MEHPVLFARPRYYLELLNTPDSNFRLLTHTFPCCFQLGGGVFDLSVQLRTDWFLTEGGKTSLASRLDYGKLIKLALRLCYSLKARLESAHFVAILSNELGWLEFAIAIFDSAV